MVETEQILAAFCPLEGPGAVVAYARGRGAPTTECCGYADIRAKKPLSPSSLFDLASVGKSFTGAAVALLCERGDLEVDAPIDDYLSLEQPAKARHVSVRDLLQHTSDLPDYLEHFSEKELTTTTNDEVVAFAGEHLPNCTPGAAFIYSNTNYALLASILERVSGKPYAALLEERLFRPLGLRETHVLIPGQHVEERVTGYVNTRLGSAEWAEHRLDLHVFGDGGVFSTAGNLVTWFQALAGGQLLQKDTELLVPGRLDDGSRIDYGWGVVLEGGKWLGHTGSWYGAEAFAGHSAATDTTLAVLSNEAGTPVTRLAHAYSRQLRSQD